MRMISTIADSSFLTVAKGHRRHPALFLLGVAGLLLIWWVGSILFNNPIFLPSPFVVIDTLVRLLKSGVLVENVSASFARVVIGFGIGAGAALVIGILMGVYSTAERAFEPMVEMFRSIPPYAMIPIALLTFGIGPGGKLFILAYASFFPVLVSTVNGLENVRRPLVEGALTLGASRFFIILHVLLPAAIPQIAVGLRLGFGAAWLSLIAAEMVASPDGLGFMISDARELLQTDVVLAGMLVIGMLGYAFNRIFLLLERT